MKDVIKLENVEQYNDLFGLETLHPLVSVVDLSQATRHPEHFVLNYGVYALFLKQTRCGDIRYGRQTYGSVLKVKSTKKNPYPEKAEKIKACLESLSQKEKENVQDIDTMSGLFGEIMAELFAYQKDAWEPLLRKMGFYMGKFIYLLDAYEDVEEDKKKQNYNPLAIYSKKADFEEFAGHLLTMMIAEASRAFEQLPILKNAEILRNILYSGVWCRYEMIKEKRRQKAGEKADE